MSKSNESHKKRPRVRVNNNLTLARAKNPESEQNKLLEAHGARLDVGATSATGTRDQAMAAVGKVNRPPNR